MSGCLPGWTAGYGHAPIELAQRESENGHARVQTSSVAFVLTSAAAFFFF